MQFPKTKQTEVTNKLAMQLFSDFFDNVPVIALSGAKYNRAFEAIYKTIGEYFPESKEPESGIQNVGPKIVPVTPGMDLKEGDLLLITDKDKTTGSFKIELVKRTTQDGTEVIINRKENIYFNFEMFFQGKSWVKELYIIKHN